MGLDLMDIAVWISLGGIPSHWMAPQSGTPPSVWALPLRTVQLLKITVATHSQVLPTVLDSASD